MLFAANMRQLMGERLGVPLVDQVGILCFFNACVVMHVCAVRAVHVLRARWVVGFRGWGWRVGRCKCVGWGRGLKGWELAPGMKVFNAENAGWQAVSVPRCPTCTTYHIAMLLTFTCPAWKRAARHGLGRWRHIEPTACLFMHVGDAAATRLSAPAATARCENLHPSANPPTRSHRCRA